MTYLTQSEMVSQGQACAPKEGTMNSLMAKCVVCGKRCGSIFCAGCHSEDLELVQKPFVDREVVRRDGCRQPKTQARHLKRMETNRD